MGKYLEKVEGNQHYLPTLCSIDSSHFDSKGIMLVRPKFHGSINTAGKDLLDFSDEERFKLGFVESYDICNRDSISPIDEAKEITSVDHLLETSKDIYRVRRYHRYIDNDLSFMVQPTRLVTVQENLFGIPEDRKHYL